MASREDDESTEGSSDEETEESPQAAMCAQPPEPHIMLSYQWDNQKLVEDIYLYLKEAQSMPVWMDKHGGMKENIFERLSNFLSLYSYRLLF